MRLKPVNLLFIVATISVCIDLCFFYRECIDPCSNWIYL